VCYEVGGRLMSFVAAAASARMALLVVRGARARGGVEAAESCSGRRPTRGLILVCTFCAAGAAFGGVRRSSGSILLLLYGRCMNVRLKQMFVRRGCGFC